MTDLDVQLAEIKELFPSFHCDGAVWELINPSDTKLEEAPINEIELKPDGIAENDQPPRPLESTDKVDCDLAP